MILKEIHYTPLCRMGNSVSWLFSEQTASGHIMHLISCLRSHWKGKGEYKTKDGTELFHLLLFKSIWRLKKRETSVICIYLVHSTNILNDVTGPSLSHMNACCLQNAHLQEPGSKAGVKLNSGAPMWDPGIHSSSLTWYGTILSPHLLLHVLL